MTGPDAVIVGGGPAGTAAAITLAAHGARVLLLEREATTPAKVGEIVHASVQLPLRELGLWERFLASARLRQSATLSCWGGPEAVFKSPLSCPYGEGFFVDRAEFETMVWDAAIAAGIDARRGCGPVRTNSLGKEARVVWSGGDLVTPLLVDATGRSVGVALGARERVDRLVGLLHYCLDVSGMASDPHLLIEATPDGWWYSAPLPGGRAVFAFMSDTDLVPKGADYRRQWLSSQLSLAPFSRERRGACGFDTPCVIRPAASERRVNANHDWCVAVGDAAASYDPLAGAGVALALARGIAVGRLLGTRESKAMAIAEYREGEAAAWTGYLSHRRFLYGQETRWADAPFWARRRAN